MDIFIIIFLSIFALLIISCICSIIYCSISIKKTNKDIIKLYQNELWDEFINMAKDGMFTYDPDMSIKNMYEVFALHDRNGNRRYEFVKFDTGAGIFTAMTNNRDCVLCSFNKDKVEKMYNILKSQIA